MSMAAIPGGDLLVNIVGAMGADKGLVPTGTGPGEALVQGWGGIGGFSPTDTVKEGSNSTLNAKSRAQCSFVLKVAGCEDYPVHIGRGGWSFDFVAGPSLTPIACKGFTGAVTNRTSCDIALGGSAEWLMNVNRKWKRAQRPIYLALIRAQGEVGGQIAYYPGGNLNILANLGLEVAVIDIQHAITACDDRTGPPQPGMWSSPLSKLENKGAYGVRPDVRRVKDANGQEQEYVYNRIWVRPAQIAPLKWRPVADFIAAVSSPTADYNELANW